MKYLRAIAFWLAWLLFVLGYRLSSLAKDGVGEADE